MSGATIICPHCKMFFEISDAIQHQIDDELLKAKSEQSEALRKEYNLLAETKIIEAVSAAVAEAQQASELQLARERQNAKLELEKAKQSTELSLSERNKSLSLSRKNSAEKQKLQKKTRNDFAMSKKNYLMS